MILEMKVPSPGESITEVEVASWLVEDGDYVEKDQAIAEVDSDKATLELPAEESGIITLKAEEGDAVDVGAVICLIDMSAAKTSDTKKKEVVKVAEVKEATKEVEAPATENSTYATGTASPAAKKILAEKNIDAASIKGTGKDGRITKEDAVNAVPSMGEALNDENRKSDRKKLSMLRRKVAERLVSVKNETAMLTTFNEVNMKPVMDLRNQYKEQFQKVHGVKLGFMSFFTRAVVEALKRFPDVNASIDGKEIVYHGYFDVGIAVSTERGLVAPVLRDVDQSSMADIEKQIAESRSILQLHIIHLATLTLSMHLSSSECLA